MTSLFDSSVYQRRNHTPWARMDFMSFAREMMWNGTDEKPAQVKITLTYRHSVSTRQWWEIEWISCDGSKRTASSQEFQLMLWRAAEQELMARNRIDNQKIQESAGVNMKDRNIDIVEKILDGAQIKKAAEAFGISSARARTILLRHCKKINPDLYSAGICHGATNNYITPPLHYLVEHREDFINPKTPNHKTQSDAHSVADL